MELSSEFQGSPVQWLQGKGTWVVTPHVQNLLGSFILQYLERIHQGVIRIIAPNKISIIQ